MNQQEMIKQQEIIDKRMDEYRQMVIDTNEAILLTEVNDE